MDQTTASYYYFMGMMTACCMQALAQAQAGLAYHPTPAQANMVKHLAISEGVVNPPRKPVREHPSITDARKFGTYKGR